MGGVGVGRDDRAVVAGLRSFLDLLAAGASPAATSRRSRTGGSLPSLLAAGASPAANGRRSRTGGSLTTLLAAGA